MLGEAITADKIFIQDAPSGVGYTASISHETSIVAAVTMGFSTDPIARWVYPRAADYFQWFPQFVGAFAGGAIANGTAFSTSNYSGAALWLKPGVNPDENALFNLVQRSLPTHRHEEVLELFEKMSAGHPADTHWYLPMIGVDTFQQGNGIGSQLMRQALAVVDDDGLPAYLESSNPRNISLYRRFGFEVIGEIRAGGSPPLVPMLREAQR